MQARGSAELANSEHSGLPPGGHQVRRRGDQRRKDLFLCAMLCGGLISCTSAGSRPAAAGERQLEGDMGLLEPFRAISPREPVPHFMVLDTTGSVHDSRELLGQGPLVISFFASWCESCALKAPMLKRGLERAPTGTKSIWVSLDDDSTWHNVSAYVESNDLNFPVVRGAAFAKFALAFDPVQAVPAIVVLDLAGYVVDFQIGVRASDAQRLDSALELAAKPRRAPTSLLPSTPAPAVAAVDSLGLIRGRVVFDWLTPRALAQAVD